MQTDPVEQDNTDRLLFEALMGGDAGAMTELIDRHERWLRSVVYGVLGRSEELDDVVQNVWLNVWRRADSLKNPAHWKTWLYRLARNTAIDSGRKTTRRRGFTRGWIENVPRDQVDSNDARKKLIVAERHRKVLEAIEGLPAIYREPFVLRHMKEWNYKQIAEAMDLPVNTVEIRLVRARRKLREILGPGVRDE